MQKPYRRTRNRYQPNKPYTLSRSKIELFLNCPRCFYLDRRHGVDRPKSSAFKLNLTVDELLKREFDTYRKEQTPHPIMTENNLSLVPALHPELDTWREVFQGVRYTHKPTNLTITGAIDDLWQDTITKQYIVVDYKATSRAKPIKTLDGPWAAQYKRQLECYVWLLEKHGLAMSIAAYILYCTADEGKATFEQSLDFSCHLIDVPVKTEWIEPTLTLLKQTLDAPNIPPADAACQYCAYTRAKQDILDPPPPAQPTLF